MADGDGVRLERDGTGIVAIVLDRPKKQNAVSSAMWRALARYCDAIEADPSVRVVIVRGAPPAFSAGADIAEFPEVFADEEAARRYNDLVQDALARLEGMSVPTIAQVAGSCIGGGCGLALACDLRMAAADARFGITPARLGLAYSLGDVKRLVDLVGPARAKDILFSARLLDAEEALRIGLVDRVVSPEELDGTVRAYARSLLDLSGSSHRRIKRIVRLVLDGAVAETEESRMLRDRAVSHPDFVEGRRAFLEKRRPRFT
ncbi:enoyl-CoA hydratase/isomerase family protein [Benzoatithermus flavus]|uniref:Enoyl-CoA hydratase-related protein n=1 Tax=Benzoatithermus flavus TaxID=3108223 RepID=A0ABU8XYM6_9PROT